MVNWENTSSPTPLLLLKSHKPLVAKLYQQRTMIFMTHIHLGGQGLFYYQSSLVSHSNPWNPILVSFSIIYQSIVGNHRRPTPSPTDAQPIPSSYTFYYWIGPERRERDHLHTDKKLMSRIYGFPSFWRWTNGSSPSTCIM
jgi:hypothetical protein